MHAACRTLCVLAVLTMSACAPAPTRETAPAAAPTAAAPRFPAAFYDERAGSGRVYDLLAEDSQVAVHVFRAGALARRGHNHVVVLPRFRGAVYLPEKDPAAARVDLVFEVQALDVDPPDRRARIGGAFAGELDREARDGTRGNMLGAEVLDAERHPRIGIRSTAVHGELPALALEIEITLHGIARTQLVPVHVALEGDTLRARGALAVRQSDFGIEPFSAAGGLLRVADVVTVEFELAGRAR